MIVSQLFSRLESVDAEEQRLKENSITEVHWTWLPIYDARPAAPAEASRRLANHLHHLTR